MFFRNKVFSKVCNGLSKEARATFKAKRQALLDEIQKAVEEQKQVDSVSAMSIEQLEAILEAKKKQAK